jgi:hypothetical protein
VNVVFNFFQASVSEQDIGSFIKKIDEVLREFAGDAYHFRYEVDQSFPGRSAREAETKPGGTGKGARVKGP